MNTEIHATAPEAEVSLEKKAELVSEWYRSRFKNAPWRKERTEEELEKCAMTRERCLIRMNQVEWKLYSAQRSFHHSAQCREWIERHHQIQLQLEQSFLRKKARREAWEARQREKEAS